MVAGRKRHTIQVPEKPPRPPLPRKMSASARNLRKSDLGGAIFGCKDSTMKECLGKQLFGLPYAHFSFVRNIDPRLPLFLFNYDDRKLYGIYEAAGPGQMCINPYAWTEDGKEKTDFPAQVRIHIRKQCQPLTEKQYSLIIKDNYYSQKHFWFELDHAQTKGLMAVFERSTIPSKTIVPPGLLRKTNKFPPSPSKEWKASVKSGSGEQKWDSKPSVAKANAFDYDDIEDGSSSKRSTSDPEEDEIRESDLDWEKDWVGENVQDDMEARWPEKNVQRNHSSVSPHRDAENQPVLEEQSGVVDFETVLEKLRELSVELENSAPSNMSADIHEESRLRKESFPLVEEQENTTTSDLYHGNAELVQTINELKETTAALQKKQFESDREMQQLRNVVKESVKVIIELKGQVKELETKLSLDGDASNKCRGQYLGLGKVIYLIGGYNGTSWLSSLDSFSPTSDILKPLKSMSSARSYASAAALNGNLYVFGGGDGNSWFDTVECYSPRDNEWTLCPQLIRKKGSLGGATLNGKIFAIGGGDESESFAEVEMFDPALGRWVNSQPMFQKRFATAAAELHGALYAVGGFDGNTYLESVERYDPRVAYWTRIPSMKTGRGAHSVAVLNEKLYVVGGHDGEKMISSVEVFDPRGDAWMTCEPMSAARGYAAAAVLDDSLFVIGGFERLDKLIDIVECYKEGAGWAVVDSSSSIGKRSFLSATVV